MKAVFFDWDGTLVDSLPMLFSAHNHVREQLGYPLWSRDEYMKHMLHSTRALYPRIYGDKADGAIDMLYSYIHETHLQHLRMIDGAEDLVTSLAEKGVAMGIVSNKRNDVLRKEVEHYGWQKYFGTYIGAGVAVEDKPSGAPLLHALGLHPSKPSIKNMLYVGDTESDLGCAREAGCPVLFLPHAPRSDELIQKYKPAYIAHDLHEAKSKIMEFVSL